jgi:predicted Zn-dependent protease
MIPASLLLLALASPARPAAQPADEAALERAIQGELGRAKGHLKEEGYPPIYFTQLTVWDLADWDQWSAMGAPRAEATMRQRIALADMRVGSPALDNHPVSPRSDYMGTPISFADDEYSLRHALWRILDGAYKSATADYLRKQGQEVSRGRTDYDTDDLSAEPPALGAAQAPRIWDLERLKRLDDAVGDPFRAARGLLHAESHVGVRRLRTRVRGTDGLSVDKNDDWAKIEIEAVALSTDGLRETVARDWHARTPEALPTEGEMRRAGRAMVKDLEELRVAVTTSPFSAPTLIDPTVAAAVVYSLGLGLSGEEQRNPAGAQTFRGRLGDRVLSESLTLVDDPTQGFFRGRPLFGTYEYDDQGVAARRVTLIDRGVLRGFLLSRYPVKDFPRSNGHGRAALGQYPTGVPGNLFLTTAESRSAAALLARLREECRRQGKPFGLWVRNLRGWSQSSGGGQGSIRLLADVSLVEAETGRLTRVRDLDLVGTPLVMAESVLEAGDDPEVSDTDASAPASIVTPSLLLTEAELQRSETKPERSPILPPPQRPVPEMGAAPTTKTNAAFVQADRYRLSRRVEKLDVLDVPGLLAWRQTLTPEGLVIDAKVGAGSREALRAAERRLAAAVAALVPGGVRKTVLFPAAAATAYRARYDDGWPDEGPR